jgi:hypothetical protein
LVVVLLNPNRPRDRSHYERFSYWHSVFYRDVEATSVTPWSSRALDRGLPAITVALARHLSPQLSWARDAGNAAAIDAIQAEVAQRLGDRARRSEPNKALSEHTETEVRQRVMNLLDKWIRIARDNDGLLQYGREAGELAPLLHTPLDPDLKELKAMQQEFLANWSLRDVEPSAALIRQRPDGDEELS